jgi:phospholipase C
VHDPGREGPARGTKNVAEQPLGTTKPRTRDRWTTLAVTLGVVAGLVVPLAIGFEQSTTASPQNSAQVLAFNEHIDHIVFLVMENHAYDNYFGAYCLNVSAICPTPNDGLSLNSCVPLESPTAPCVRPFPFNEANWSIGADMPHDWNASHRAFDGGRMDGFLAAEGSGVTPFGYYDGSTAPLYWDIAEQYSLDDAFFSSILAYSLPNHWHIVAGQAPQEIVANFTNLGPHSPPGTIARDHKYLDQANRTRSVEDLLLNSSVSWKYYDYTLGNYSKAIAFNTTGPQANWSAGPAYDYWNPEAAKAESYNASFVDHFTQNTKFYGDARNGTLPDISWVIPSGQDSDHPPQNSTVAQAYVTSIVNAVESSPDWNSTALFVTWDDYGGFYDGVDPPVVNGGQQLGFRVPLLMISPYARQDYITPDFGYFESILHLMEERFDLGCITSLDCSAPLPLDAFDFSAPPRPPMLFPSSVANATYPMVPANSTGEGAIRPYYPPAEFSSFPQGELPDID